MLEVNSPFQSLRSWELLVISLLLSVTKGLGVPLHESSIFLPPCFVVLSTDNTLLCCLYLANSNPSRILLQKFHLNFPNWIIVFSLRTFTRYLCTSIILPYYIVVGVIVIFSCWNWKLHENEILLLLLFFFFALLCTIEVNMIFCIYYLLVKCLLN